MTSTSAQSASDREDLSCVSWTSVSSDPLLVTESLVSSKEPLTEASMFLIQSTSSQVSQRTRTARRRPSMPRFTETEFSVSILTITWRFLRESLSRLTWNSLPCGTSVSRTTRQSLLRISWRRSLTRSRLIQSMLRRERRSTSQSSWMRRRPWFNLEASSMLDRLSLPRKRETKELLIRSELLRSRSSSWNKTNKLYYVLFSLIFYVGIICGYYNRIFC